MTGSDAFDPDVERATEVDDYTGEVPRVDPAAPPPEQAGFGDGDIADLDEADPDVVSTAAPAEPAADAGQPGPDTAAGDAPEAGAEPVDVAALIAERDQYRELAMRIQADFENYRKRAAAQAAADAERATGRLAEALLPVLDATEAAYLAHPDEVGPLLNLMLAELKKHGLESVDIVDRPFDPEVAEAVAHQPGEGGEVVVAEVLRTGYTWRGRTLRAAMVRTTD